jgi:hypothetical protein
MAEIIAQFADGRLLVQENRAIETHYVSGGVAVRIGHVKTVEKVVSLQAYLSGYPQFQFAAPLNEVLVSGDTIIPILRRADLYGLTSGIDAMSGYATVGVLSGVIASGTAYMGLIASGFSSGKIKILANVIGF